MKSEVGPPPDDQLLLEMRGLRVEGRGDDRREEIVKGVDLRLARGEILGLIGESGAGKSTIGLAAMGYARGGCRISGGEILFNGRDLRRLPEAELRRLRGVRIAYVAQGAAAAFNPAHRLIDQYVEAAVVHGVKSDAEARSDAVDLYCRLKLPDPDEIGARYPHQVSSSQLRRAMVAMAMACKPDLIIFDEPTTALDVTTQIEVLAAIKDMVRQSRTAALYITHDLALVAQLADRIMVLRRGLVVEEGPTRDLLANPKQEYTRKLLAVWTAAKPEQRGHDMLLRIHNVTAAYGGLIKVLEAVTIQVPRGRTVAVVGESGSGKSTLARVICGLLPPVQGELLFKGKPLPPMLKQRSKEALRRIQFIYQTPATALNPRQRVREIIGRPLDFYHGLEPGAREARLAELMQLIELAPYLLDRYPSELSSGQKQRVCIARAFAAEPDLIICDEVTSALGPLVAEGIIKLLLRLQKELRVSYLFITHDIGTARAIADEIVVMHRGRVVEHGPKSQVLEHPQYGYTMKLLSSVPEMDPDWLDRQLATRPAP